jgi:hypothetical protein
LWPFYLIYAPLVFVWLYYAFKARYFWFFSPANPTLEFSGFEGESKKEMYEQLPQQYYPETVYVTAKEDYSKLLKAVANKHFTYPLAVKPQTGMHALLFRKIENEVQLKQYHSYVNVDYLVQEYVDHPMEFSVFHIRYPNESKGKITGFILKDYLAVTGDGTSTLLQLIKQHPKAKLREEEMKQRHAKHLDDVIAKDEKFYLSIAGNHNRGARFVNLQHEIDEKLCSVFDKISVEAGQFYFGRYDLKCTSVEDLKEGKNVAILEFNGAGAEPNHIYDCNMKYKDALKIIVQHWDDLYKIGRINNQKGVPYWRYSDGMKYLMNAKRFFKKLNEHDLNFQL